MKCSVRFCRLRKILFYRSSFCFINLLYKEPLNLCHRLIFVNAKIYYINIGKMKISVVLFDCLFFALSQLINDDLCVNRPQECLYLISGSTQKRLSLYSVL